MVGCPPFRLTAALLRVPGFVAVCKDANLDIVGPPLEIIEDASFRRNKTSAGEWIDVKCWPWLNAVLWLSCGQSLGRVDGFDQDEAESQRDERAVILRRLLA